MSAFTALATIAYKSPGRVEWAESVRANLNFLNRGVAQTFVLFDATTATITSVNSMNVSNITQDATGRFTLTFVTGFANTAYMVAGGGQSLTSTESCTINLFNSSTAKTTGSVKISTFTSLAGYENFQNTFVFVMGTGN